MFSPINNLRENKEIINKSFEIFKKDYVKYAKTHKGIVSNRKLDKIINSSIKKVEANENEKEVLNDFYDMIVGMFFTMNNYELVVSNINELLDNN
jgi:GTP1/Obg family GTP-binding protein